MLLDFGYLYKFVMFYFFFFNNRLKKSQLAKILYDFFLFLLKIGSVGPVDKQINLILPNGAVSENGLSVGRIQLQEADKCIIANNLINSFSHILESANPLTWYL